MHPGMVLLFHAGTGQGPCFKTRSGAPAEADLRQALNLLSARRVQLGGSEKQAVHEKPDQIPATPVAASGELIECVPCVHSDTEVS